MVLIILLLLFHTGHGVDILLLLSTLDMVLIILLLLFQLDMVLIILLLLFHTGHGVDYPTTTVPHWTWC
ncbi:hypothetical protein DPMN_130811 [Dreissena polymorpha]|uniref:Uncharacterized protein n=1 Tax=Dreissena polymorpha TaxID=45954 RepID=A0A9D4HBP3_DREPO|nr:hypothetical protein DPMN_130811 [Dreissena polymorpha]